MAKALEKAGFEVVHIGSLKVPFHIIYKLVRKIYGLFGVYFDENRQPFVAKYFAKQIENKLSKGSFDFVLSPGTMPVAYLNTKIPKIIWCDATFASMVGFYPGKWSKFAKVTIANANMIENKAINTSALALYCSEWAAKSACDFYGASPDKVAVIPFGANFEVMPTTEQIEAAISLRSRTKCNLLFIGVEWFRKGGDIVIKTAEELRRRGVDVGVDIVGCEPIGTIPDYVCKHGFISKSNAEGRKQIEALMLQSHFLFVPSISECFGMVYAEASAYGMPSIAHAVGGVTTAVINGENGFALPLGSTPFEFAVVIERVFSSEEAYGIAARNARIDFEQRLNWNASIKKFATRLADL